ncbi:hypothetical protein M9H77_12395 [Catharanthus roseus]|uniref:Uncharacterized protein n=1 Tax=Catharanthus roseus TaxID=4058 RepID=A0ACC0BH90_CATRO|nr:hypothetical protein M9H77_12395 [Catharanthus roseus]
MIKHELSLREYLMIAQAVGQGTDYFRILLGKSEGCSVNGLIGPPVSPAAPRKHEWSGDAAIRLGIGKGIAFAGTCGWVIDPVLIKLLKKGQQISKYGDITS